MIATALCGPCTKQQGLTSTHLKTHVLYVVISRLYVLLLTQQSGNCNDYIEMHEIFNPEIPGLELPNPGISGLRKMPGFEIPGLESLIMSSVD